MQRTNLTESQYMELRRYEDGNHRWVNGGPVASLVSRGLISRAPHDPSMWRITEAGWNALSAFKTRYGL